VADKVIMPKLAMAMQEGQIIEWLVEEGDWVEKGQDVMNVETEKVVHTCEAPSSGFLHILVPIGQIVSVFGTVALLVDTESELAQLQSEAPVTEAKETPTEVEAIKSSQVDPVLPTARVGISPIAKKIALKNKLDYSKLKGSGSGGRITKQDVEEAIAARAQLPESGKATPVSGALESTGRQIKNVIPLIGGRRTIADRMHQSLAVAAQMSFMGEIDAEALVGFREGLLEKEDNFGVRISYTDLLVLALAKAVQAVPIVNASLVENEIRVWESVNIGVAVAVGNGESESGLVVPVIKDADKKSIQEISIAVKDLTSRARDRKLTLDDVQDGTITLSNIGMLVEGWTVSTPIINQPETMIVQPGAICDRPMVKKGQLVIGKCMSLSITFDHRVVDGVPATSFFNALVNLIENPVHMLLD